QRGAGPGPYLLVRYQRAHIAVMAQKLVADDGVGQPRVLRALTSTRRPEATRELARAAVFSPHESLRAKALKALGPRPAAGPPARGGAPGGARRRLPLPRAGRRPQRRPGHRPAEARGPGPAAEGRPRRAGPARPAASGGRRPGGDGGPRGGARQPPGQLPALP